MHGPKKNLNVMSNEIRDYIDKAEENNENKIALCDFIIKELPKLILPKTKYKNNDERVKDAHTEVLDHFDFMKHLLTGEWKYEEFFEPGEYSFEELLNGYLTEFWNLCDMMVNEDTRFCWVEI